MDSLARPRTPCSKPEERDEIRSPLTFSCFVLSRTPTTRVLLPTSNRPLAGLVALRGNLLKIFDQAAGASGHCCSVCQPEPPDLPIVSGKGTVKRVAHRLKKLKTNLLELACKEPASLFCPPASRLSNGEADLVCRNWEDLASDQDICRLLGRSRLPSGIMAALRDYKEEPPKTKKKSQSHLSRKPRQSRPQLSRRPRQSRRPFQWGLPQRLSTKDFDLDLNPKKKKKEKEKERKRKSNQRKEKGKGEKGFGHAVYCSRIGTRDSKGAERRRKKKRERKKAGAKLENHGKTQDLTS